MEKLETGLSGCKLELIDSNILRKHSSSEPYNKRLELQIRKQQLFSNRVCRNIETPKILNVDRQHLYYFDMEYVSGNSFAEYFSVSSLKDIEFVLDSLYGYFDDLISNARFYKPEVSKKILLDKIESLSPTTYYMEEIFFIRQVIEQVEMHIPQTFCHGDLTFTNIIFHQNRLYFIDFLDCFIDSFLSDLVKLKQDLWHHWSLEVQDVKSLRIRQIYSFLWSKIEERYDKYVNSCEFAVLDCMNTLRLEPYLTNDYQRSIMKRMLDNSSLHANFNCPDGGTVK
jgi:tRNA A-37 threonylcarbamoyl transferase component Bud32